MKPYLLVWLIGVLPFGCINFQKVLVEYDYSYLGEFNRYQTYNFFTDSKYNSDNSGNIDLIKNTVNSRMQLLGYLYDDQNPDISIAISFFQKDTRFVGFNQPVMERWIDQPDQCAMYEPSNYKLYAGTLLIQFIDNDKTTAIWRGYSSGGFGKLSMNDARVINHATWQIMDKYRVFAKGSIARLD